MQYTKHVIATDMPKCYAVGMFDGNDAPSFVVATEKAGPIRRFALDGTPMEEVAPGPGGVMTIAQVPGRKDQLLSTYLFLSPNYGGDDAKIVSYTRASDGTWNMSVLCDLPYVHRFGILRGADGSLYLLACTIKKSCRQVKDDWRSPGEVWGARLEGALERYDAGHQLPLTLLAGAQLQNHGFYLAPDASFALVGTAAGVFRYTPPAEPGGAWDVACLIVNPTSDMCMADLDGDGRDEIVTISRFHGDTLQVWHEAGVEDAYECVWTDPERRAFLHAIWSGTLGGAPCAVLGNRKGGRDLFRLAFADGAYALEPIDHDRGPANCWAFSAPDGSEHIVAANRETDEVALYDVEA